MNQYKLIFRCIFTSVFLSLVAISSWSQGVTPNQYCSWDSPMLSGDDNYRNLFTEYGIATQTAVNTQVNTIWERYKNGNSSQKLFYMPGSNSNMLYVLNPNYGETPDIRSEGMSYAMFAAVMMNDKATFDALWRFAHEYMLQYSGGQPQHFAWQLNTTNFNPIDSNPAADGELYFAMSLGFAHWRWGSDRATSNGVMNYWYWSEKITLMLENNLFYRNSSQPATQTQILFSPDGDPFTDPSYHIPAFYAMFQQWWNIGIPHFWYDAIRSSRSLLPNAMHATTGLTSDYAWFDGQPVSQMESGTDNPHASMFAHDSWRVVQNIAMDYYWCSLGSAQSSQVQKILTFFNNQGGTGARNYGQVYEKNGTVGNDEYDDYKATGLIAMNAVGALAVNQSLGQGFVQDLWDEAIPEGEGRYYDGMLYLLGYLHVSGKAQIFDWWHNDPYYIPSASTLVLPSASPNLAQVRIIITNSSENTVSNFTAKYFITAENNKTPVADDYWTPNANVWIESLGGNEYAVVMDYSGKTLAPGATLPASGDGDTFGLHYNDWSNFDTANDFSHPTSTVYMATDKIAIYNSAGELVLGTEPDINAPGDTGIRSAWSNNFLTATNQQNNSDTRAQPGNNSWTSQDWEIENISGSNAVRIRNIWSGKYLHVQSNQENSKVVTYALNPGWASQQWIIESAEGNSKRLKNVWTGRYLTVVDAGAYSSVIAKSLNTSWSSQRWMIN